MRRVRIFSWGYWGWGNATRQLVAAVDAVERSRGFRPPIFVDVRLRRSVRAKGFNGKAFESLLGPRRYKWIPELGNKQIASKSRRGPRIVIKDPSAASELLELALDAARARRRVIFFCSCEFAKEDGKERCHRHRVGTLLLKEARRRGVTIEVAEWPGGEPSAVRVVQASQAIVREASNARWRMPLEDRQTPLKWLSEPLGTPVVLTSKTESVAVFAAWPAYHRGWQLSWVYRDGRTEPAQMRRRARIVRRDFGFEPRRA